MVSAREDIHTRGEETRGLFRGDAETIGRVLAVDYNEIGLILLDEPPQTEKNGPQPRLSEDIAEDKSSQ
jgi:hypothetical protein